MTISTPPLAIRALAVALVPVRLLFLAGWLLLGLVGFAVLELVIAVHLLQLSLHGRQRPATVLRTQ